MKLKCYNKNMNNLEITQLNDAENLEPIPLKERTVFQIKLMQKMLDEDFLTKSRQEKTNMELAWADSYAKLVSDIIDHKEYGDIRDLIMSGQHEKAIELIIPIINPSAEKAA
jgi:hypothetical protein